MQLLASQIDRAFQMNYRQHVLADELMDKIQRLRGCFLGGSLPLPLPSAKVIAAWNDLPNITLGSVSVSMRTTLLPQAPPPSPAGSTFDKDQPTSSRPSSEDGHDDYDSWVVVDDATSCASDAMTHQALDGCATSEGDSMSRCSYPDQSLDGQTNEKDSFKSPTSTTSSSDQESHSSSSGGSPIMPTEFDNMVSQWLLDYQARGTDAFVESLIAFAAISVGTALQASRIARAIVRKVVKTSYTKGKNLEHTIRFQVLATFKKCWDVNLRNDTSTEGSSTQGHTAAPTPYSINIASMMGGLFDQKIASANDIHLCLFLLLEGEKRFDRLCAMHALLVQANDKLCKNRNLPALIQFKNSITSTREGTGEYLWVSGPHSKVVLADILALIKRWTAFQAIKREENQIHSGTGPRIIRNRRAVGPRLRNGLVAL